MLSRLLPDTVTYYRSVEGENGAGCGFERQVLSPVRLRVTREKSEVDRTVEVLGVLYLFPRELGRALPQLHAERDLFVSGACESEEPPTDREVFRVNGVSAFVGVDELKYIRVIGKAMGGESV